MLLPAILEAWCVNSLGTDLLMCSLAQTSIQRHWTCGKLAVNCFQFHASFVLACHRGVGCIFVEMLCGHPLFPGLKGVQDQLTKIFKVC